MMSCTLFDDIGVCLLEPAEQLTEADFVEATDTVDAYLVNHERLNGLVVHAEFFPWWADFAAMVAHLKFVRDHHRQINRVAICSDSEMADLLPKIASHFVAAEVRAYDGSQVSEAMHWVQGE